METLYKTKVTAKGARTGNVISDDGVLDEELSIPKEMGGEGESLTNPEQLFAAAFASSYGASLETAAKDMDVDLGDYSVTAIVEMGKNEDEDYQLSVILDTYIPGVNLETGEELVNEAHEICPYARAVADNIDVTLNLLLDE